MRLLADVHIAPRTVTFLRSLGYDIVRVTEFLPATAADEAIISVALEQGRAVLTQDLDFSGLIALSRWAAPSLLRLSSSRVEYVNSVLERVLPSLVQDILDGTIITIEDHRIRRRSLPIA
jgi:predicted nuclease of predicted toxin-antitoxin system